jgi:hypothetical protein
MTSIIGRVYRLTDPRNDLIRYIGGTVTSLDGRLKGHLSTSRNTGGSPVNRWIRELTAVGLLPLMDLIREVPEGEFLIDAEREQIKRYVLDGWPLLNRSDRPHLLPDEVVEAARRSVALLEPVVGDLLMQARDWERRAVVDAERIKKISALWAAEDARLYPSQSDRLNEAIRGHFDRLTEHSVFEFGEDHARTFDSAGPLGHAV